MSLSLIKPFQLQPRQIGHSELSGVRLRSGRSATQERNVSQRRNAVGPVRAVQDHNPGPQRQHGQTRRL